MCIDMVAKCAPNIILVCHSKDAAVGSEDLNVKQIDLLGKNISVRSKYLVYLYRN